MLPGRTIYSKNGKSSVHWGRVYQHGVTLIPARISNHVPNDAWNEITYPFPNFVEAWEYINNLIPYLM